MRIDAIAFNVDTDSWPDPSVACIEAVYRLDVNEYRGRLTPQLLVEQMIAEGGA
jgi:single-stranded-DNA-specific exonuclease